MRYKLLIFMLLLLSSQVNANDRGDYPDWTFGVEWDYSMTFFAGEHNYFFSLEGYRVDEQRKWGTIWSNADVSLHVGYNINSNWNLSLYAGYAKIYTNGAAIPISLRGTYYFGNDPSADRWLCFMDLGTGVGLNSEKIREIVRGKCGGGYRISLSRDTKLDFLLSLHSTLMHPDITYDGEHIPYEMVRRNNSYSCAVSLGISLTF